MAVLYYFELGDSTFGSCMLRARLSYNGLRQYGMVLIFRTLMRMIVKLQEKRNFKGGILTGRFKIENLGYR